MRNLFPLILGCLLCDISLSAHAKTLTYTRQLPWSLEVGLGYGHYQNMINGDGYTALASIGIAKELIQIDKFHAGLQIDVQTGNSGRLYIPPYERDMLGGLTLDSEIKPSIDLLATAKYYPQKEDSYFILGKAGLIYRRWQFSRTTLSDVSKVSPEFELGMGIDVSRFASISLSYQHIFGGNPKLETDMTNETLSVSNIPEENAVILGLSIYLQ